ncbi:MAG TPA: hypothetical protein PKK06_14340 [Phycisphaerae bacterium]|nr:hypothetical protein [Phycisphaerae bacterium]HNU46314.1 hypothetical protein [Phycisphaerae bacterium]
MTKDVQQGSVWQRVLVKLDRQWTAYLLERRKTRHRRKSGVPARKTTAFVVGCQRSGTNMALRTLGRSLDVDVLEEVDERAFDDRRIRDKAVLASLVEASTAKCVVFKPVCDSHRVAELLAEHALSKSVWMYRRYQDVANSAVERWGDKTRRWLEDLLQGGGDWGVRQWNKEKVTAECVAEVRQACAESLTDHGAAALFWYMRNRTFFEQGLDHHPDVLLVNYEAAVAQAEREFARVCAFLEVGFYPGMVERVFRSSVGKREFPAIAKPIAELCDAMKSRLDAVYQQQVGLGR